DTRIDADCAGRLLRGAWSTGRARVMAVGGVRALFHKQRLLCETARAFAQPPQTGSEAAFADDVRFVPHGFAWRADYVLRQRKLERAGDCGVRSCACAFFLATGKAFEGFGPATNRSYGDRLLAGLPDLH